MTPSHFCAKWSVYFAHISRKLVREIMKSPKEKSFRANRAKWRAVFAQNLRTFPLGGDFRGLAQGFKLPSQKVYVLPKH